MQKKPRDTYSALWLYLAQSRSGNKEASQELETNAAKFKQSDWPFPAIQLFLRQRSPEATLAWAEQPDDACEEQFYIGEWHLLRGDHSAAKEALQATAADTCPKNLDESASARAEPNRLGN